MEFIGIIGNRGSGKTNIMTAFLKDYADAGIPVIANYNLKFSSVTMSFDQIRQLPRKLAENRPPNGLVIGLDELGTGADSYEFFTGNSKAITTPSNQLRKFGAKVLFTAQRFNQIVKRLRDQTDGFVMMRDYDANNFLDENGNLVTNHRDVCNGIFEARFLDEERTFIRKEDFDGRSYWPLYDTYEPIWDD